MTKEDSSIPTRIGSRAIRPESTDDVGVSPSERVETRRRFLQVASVVGLGSLAGCTVSVDEDGISWGDSEAETPEPETTEETETPEPETTEETETPEPETTEETETPEPTPRPTAERYEVEDFELTSHNGDLDVYGRISMRGVYDETEYINPRGRSSWEVLDIDEDEYLDLEENTPQELFVSDSTIVFPAEAIENLAESEPYVIVRVDLIERRESTDNEFLGWNSHRVFLDDIDGEMEGEEVTMQFTGGGNDVRFTYTVTPVYD